MTSINLSLIMPVYNREHCLDISIGSLKYINALNYELIIVDDGSTDSSILIAEELIKKYKIKNYKIIPTRINKGVSHARNIGIDNAQGKYILFLDSDDELLPEAAHLIVKGIESNFDISCYGYLINGVKSPLPKSNNLFLEFLTSKFSNTNTILCKRNVFENIRFKEGFSIGEDTDLWARLLYSNLSKNYFSGSLASYNFSPRAKFAEKHPFFDISLWELDLSIKQKNDIYARYIKHRTYLQVTNRKISIKDLLKKKNLILFFLYIFGQKGFLFIWKIRNIKRKLVGGL